jgi:hypothetical protein
MSILKWFGSLVLAATVASATFAEANCPGNVESLPYRSLNRHQIVVPVSINHSGPYNFLLDTGTQMTMIDPALAAELHLAGSGKASVRTGGVSASAAIAQAEVVEAGMHQVRGLKVVVIDLAVQQGKSRDVRGVLGEDFLGQFDLLIDNAHSIVCLDDSGRIRAGVKGRHVELLSPAGGDGLTRTPVVAVRLADGMRPARLELDSGADVCFLFDTSFMALGVPKLVAVQGKGATGELRSFRALPPQTVKIGSVEIAKVPFVSFSAAQKNAHTSDFDGLLPVGLFKTVFINHAEHFAVLEAW